MEESNSGISPTMLGLFGLAGLGVVYVLAKGNNGYGYNACGCGCMPSPYEVGKNTGETLAGIACNAAAINRVECAVNQLRQNDYNQLLQQIGTSQTINAISYAQNDTNSGLASISTNVGRLNDTVNSALGNRFVYAKNICSPCCSALV